MLLGRMVDHFAKGLALQRGYCGGWYGHVEHCFRSVEALVHVAPYKVASTLGVCFLHHDSGRSDSDIPPGSCMSIQSGWTALFLINSTRTPTSM